MEEKLPYYMTYPIDDYFQDNRMAKRDREYMRSIYPGIAKQTFPFIEEECDRMEYDGSMIYDEYPDKLMLRLMCSRIYDKAQGDLRIQELDFDDKESKWLRAMIEIMVYEELCKRREKKRYKRKIWY